MAIYELGRTSICRISETSFAAVGITECGDLRRLLREHIDVVSPNTLVISEEFGDWDDSRRRIDLLGIDKDARIVVIELKRGEDGGRMELQAIRYAAMVSALTFDQAASIYGSFLAKHDRDDDPRQSILDFLEWDILDEDQFGKEVRIFLASADFSKELTTSVMWLNDQGLDIQCIRLKPYLDDGRILLDVQRLIPLPEAEEYSVRIKEKQRQQRAVRDFGPDFTKYDLQIDGQRYERLPKRGTVFTVVKFLCDHDVSPNEIQSAIPWRRTTLFRSAPGKLSSNGFLQAMQEEATRSGGRKFESRRFFCADDELILFDGATFALSNQWGTSWKKAMDNLAAAFAEHAIIFTPCAEPTSIGD